MILSLTIIFLSCEGPQGEQGLTGPQGTTGQNLTGSLSGFINLWDLNGYRLHPSSLASVSIDGKNVAVNCDSTGRWQIDSLEIGTYDLNFKMNGFGTYIKKSFQFVGGSNIFYGIVTLDQLPNFFVSLLSVNSGQDVITISGNISNAPPPNQNYFIIIFAGLDSTVSCNPNQYLLDIFGYTQTTSFSTQVTKSDLIRSGFLEGSKVYFRAYGCSYLSSYGGIEGGYYIDPNTGRPNYTSLSIQSSMVASINL